MPMRVDGVLYRICLLFPFGLCSFFKKDSRLSIIFLSFRGLIWRKIKRHRFCRSARQNLTVYFKEMLKKGKNADILINSQWAMAKK